MVLNGDPLAWVTAFRLANWDTPLWVSPNRRESRFARAGGIVQYWSLHPLTPWAEHLRFHDIRDPDDARELLLRPWVASLRLPDGILDISFETAAAHGIDPSALIDNDWTPCQQWAATLAAPGVIVPSAALPGTRNLILFGPRVRSPFGVAPVDPILDTPCDPVADLSIVVTDLLPKVRWLGTSHAGYEAWQAGSEAPLPPAVVVDRHT